jgi:hypothetical protein
LKEFSKLNAEERMSTLPPEPIYDPNIPVVTPGGGTSAAYNDPNSPESLMKKVTETKAQATVDSRYDVKEGFCGYRRHHLLLPFLFLFLILLFSKTRKEVANIYLFSLASVVLILYIISSQNGGALSYT